VSINVVVSSTAAGVSVSGGTSVAITVSGGNTAAISVGGGIGPAGFLINPGTATNAFGTFQLTAGDGITISTSAAQFQIASYGTAAVSSLAPVQSVAGRVGAVQLQASDVTAGTFAVARIPTISYTALANVPTSFSPSAHTHSTSDVVSFTAAAAAAAPVQSVAGRQGAVSLAAADVGGLASVATSGSYTSLQNVPATFAPQAHTHSTADITGFTGSFAAGNHTHDAAAITSGVLELARIPTIGYTALAGVPATFAPQAHTHSTTEVVGLTASFSQVAHAHQYVQVLNGLTGTVSIAAGAGVTVSTASSSITIAAAGGGGIAADDDIDGGWFYGTSGLSRSITITSPPTGQTASSGAATFAVTAIAEPSGTLSYQWQKSDSAGFAATQRTMPASGQWYGVAYGNGTFAAVSYTSAVAATSADGITWTQRTLPTNTSWYALAFGNGTFVAVSYGNAIAATSTDGITWTQRTLPANAAWTHVSYGGGIFVAVAYDTAIAATSADGITWTQRTLPMSAGWYALAFGNGTFVAVSYGNAIAATSTDGITWTQRTLPANTTWSNIAYGGGTFVAVAYNTAIAATSADGITWTQRTLPMSAGWYGIAYGNGVFVAVANGGTIAATSADGITWTHRTLPANANWYGIAYGDGTFVATVYNYSAIAATITLSGQSDFANVSGATSSTLALTGLTNAADHLDRFRVVVSAANASSVTSQPATLTVS
jgi:cytochrome c2